MAVVRSPVCSASSASPPPLLPSPVTDTERGAAGVGASPPRHTQRRPWHRLAPIEPVATSPGAPVLHTGLGPGAFRTARLSCGPCRRPARSVADAAIKCNLAISTGCRPADASCPSPTLADWRRKRAPPRGSRPPRAVPTAKRSGWGATGPVTSPRKRTPAARKEAAVRRATPSLPRRANSAARWAAAVTALQAGHG